MHSGKENCDLRGNVPTHIENSGNASLKRTKGRLRHYRPAHLHPRANGGATNAQRAHMKAASIAPLHHFNELVGSHREDESSHPKPLHRVIEMRVLVRPKEEIVFLVPHAEGQLS